MVENLFLGLDCSTQSLSAILIDTVSKSVILEESVNFERDLPQYKTHKGFLQNTDPLLVHSPPLLWVEALDLLCQRLVKKGAPLSEIKAIGGSAQQHGSVYLNATAEKSLQTLDPKKSLQEQLKNIFSQDTAPIWMDSSTTIECEEIRRAFGGVKGTIKATGSNTFERFTGPQIRKFYKTNPKAYETTAHIALVSSFMTSILIGKIAPIDFGDGSGMNLMDIQKKSWHEVALEATAPDLASKLPSLVPSSTIVGTLHPYFTIRYGFSPKTQVLVGSGDNPNSLIGLGLVEEGMVGLSLGTSFTYFGSVRGCHLDSKGEGHLFVSPTGDYMPLLCFHNGALAIEALRHYYHLDWEGFLYALKVTPPGNHGAILLPYFEPEIVPLIKERGLRRCDLDPRDVKANCRAIIEAQMLSTKLHSLWMHIKPTFIYATGGVSIHTPILQIASDVFNCPVLQLSVSKSSALGAALRAAHGYALYEGEEVSWQAITSGFISKLIQARIDPHKEAVTIYEKMQEKYASCEQTYRGNS
jgi:xylulokinase